MYILKVEGKGKGCGLTRIGWGLKCFLFFFIGFCGWGWEGLSDLAM